MPSRRLPTSRACRSQISVHARPRRSCAPCRSSCPRCRSRMRSMMSPTCSRLIVNDTMSAQRRLSRSVQRFARDLRQVELDRRVEVVDDVVHLAQALGELAVVGLEHRQHAGQHLLDDVADAQRLARGVGDGERRRVERGRVEVARLGRVVWRAAAGSRRSATRAIGSVRSMNSSASATLKTRWNSTTSLRRRRAPARRSERRRRGRGAGSPATQPISLNRKLPSVTRRASGGERSVDSMPSSPLPRLAPSTRPSATGSADASTATPAWRSAARRRGSNSRGS